MVPPGIHHDVLANAEFDIAWSNTAMRHNGIGASGVKHEDILRTLTWEPTWGVEHLYPEPQTELRKAVVSVPMWA